MSVIKIADLNPAGSSFFTDPENYLNELSDDELAEVHGGFTWKIAAAAMFSNLGCAAIAASAISVTIVATYATRGAVKGFQAARR